MRGSHQTDTTIIPSNSLLRQTNCQGLVPSRTLELSADIASLSLAMAENQTDLPVVRRSHRQRRQRIFCLQAESFERSILLTRIYSISSATLGYKTRCHC